MVWDRKILYGFRSIIEVRCRWLWAPFGWPDLCQPWEYQSIVSFCAEARKRVTSRTNIYCVFHLLSTGVQRIVSGVFSVTGKNDEATFTIKYQGIPLNSETTIHVLGTDYDSYAVLWSCNSVAGPVGHTGNSFISPIKTKMSHCLPLFE